MEGPDRGPGKYISATDFWVDTERGVVEILSYYNKKIYSYSLDGRFIGDRNGINACSFIKRSNGNYWLCKGVTADEQIGNEQIYEVDKQNKVIRKYLPLAHTLHAGIPEKSFSVGDDQSVLYFSHFDNQVYRILPDTIRTFFEFDFGSLAYPQDLFGRPMAEVMHVMTEEDHLSVDKCLENSEYVYFFIIQTGKHYKYYHLLYHKDSGKILCKGLERTSWEYELLRGAKALTETNELIFLVNPENYNEALNRKNTLFCQKGEKLQDPDGTNNLLLKMKFRNGLFL